MSYSCAKPKPPWASSAALAASHEASEARYLAMLASAPAGCPVSYSQAAFQRIRLAACAAMWALASGNWTPWFAPIGRPKTTRSLA